MENKATHAIVLIDREAGGLSFLVERRSAAMLPVGNKPLVQIALEELHAVGIRSATIRGTGSKIDVRRFIGDGSRWGIAVSHLGWNDAAPECGDHVVAVRGDMLRPFGLLEEALKRRGEQGGADIYTALGVAVSCRTTEELHRISWNSVEATCRLFPCLINTPAVFHAANMMAVQGLVPGVRSAGRPAPDDIIVGKGSRVLSAQSSAKTVVIGVHCLVESKVTLGNDVVIGDNCIIDHGATLENCVVMAGSYIGRGVSLKDKIIDRDQVYCMQRDLSLRVDDPRFLARAA